MRKSPANAIKVTHAPGNAWRIERPGYQSAEIKYEAGAMNFLISQNGGGEYVVIDRRTNQVRYRGSLDGARQAQAQLNR